ncbi:hypothetical protein NM688_g231 [Phlebia brevispora]|uniref:Uncharacterized protein n=1 Tax=Phlebia brevispora TaxID=194682 RepID=A0ACC1TEW7_9APHY|nr:hypothetical protein NM688_g231 [Phlebia brevispora]
MGSLRSLFLAIAIVIAGVQGQATSSWPHDYPGMPKGEFSPAWQKSLAVDFQVTHPMPNVTFPLGRNWAGNIPVDRPGHPNNTLFFWGFEKERGSLTASAGERLDEPWGIWLNGGPGSSSMLGFFFENGPLHIRYDYSMFYNNYSWDHLADYFWIDQPVGTGWATADEDGFIADEDQMGTDFFGFLDNLVKVFPSLRSRPMYLTGESYSGRYIPYIMKTYFNMKNPPVKIVKFAIGDGSIGSDITSELMPMVTVLETYPQLIGYDPVVYEYFKEQSHLCGYDLNFTYPQVGHFPTFNPPLPLDDSSSTKTSKKAKLNTLFRATNIATKRSVAALPHEQVMKRDAWKRDLTGRPNGTIDPYYLCDLFDEVADYALNFSIPWKGHDDGGLDVYNIPDGLDPEAPMDASVFLNNNVTRTAIHAPTSKDWISSVFPYPFNSPDGQDPSVNSIQFFSELATNASQRHISVLLYSGNDDMLVSHRSTEAAIQNTTFGGIQGFTRRPSTPWYDDFGTFAGIVHQERNWTYVLVNNAGHPVPQQQPGRAYVLLREFILGSNPTGLVVSHSHDVTVVGGEDSALAASALIGESAIFVGTGMTQSSTVYPSATIAAWESFIATVTATGI